MHQQYKWETPCVAVFFSLGIVFLSFTRSSRHIPVPHPVKLPQAKLDSHHSCVLILPYVPRPLPVEKTGHSHSWSDSHIFMDSHPQAAICMLQQDTFNNQLHDSPQVTYRVSQIHTIWEQGHWKDSSEEEKLQLHMQTMSGVQQNRATYQHIPEADRNWNGRVWKSNSIQRLVITQDRHNDTFMLEQQFLNKELINSTCDFVATRLISPSLAWTLKIHFFNTKKC